MGIFELVGLFWYNDQISTLEQYPVPTFEELLSKPLGGKKFTKLDRFEAYYQLELNPECRNYIQT